MRRMATEDRETFGDLLTLLEQATRLLVLPERDSHKREIAALCQKAAFLAAPWAQGGSG